jgi:hypothetical protein
VIELELARGAIELFDYEHYESHRPMMDDALSRWKLTRNGQVPSHAFVGHDRTVDEVELKETYGKIARASTTLSLIRRRRRVGTALGNGLERAGLTLQTHGHIIGDGRVHDASRRGNGDDEVVAVGILLRIAGELLLSTMQLVSTGHYYAGAALVRQIVEVEYLMWAFAENSTEAQRWLNSTKQERMNFFQPRHLRQRSKGRFRDKDYGHHCEMGGHPVPKSQALLGEPDARVVEVLLIDLLQHGWRTTDSAIAWATKKNVADLVRAKCDRPRAMLKAWSKTDPLYDLPAPPRDA